MSKIWEGTFEQITPWISPSFIENSLDTAKEFKGLKALFFVVLFIGFASYALFGVSLHIGNNIDSMVGGLDIHNEFIPFISTQWYIHFEVLFLVFATAFMMFYRERNRIKGNMLYHICMTLFMLFYSVFFFKVTQLFVSLFTVRMIYNLLFVSTYIYSIWQGFQNAKQMIYNNKERTLIVKWVSRNKSKLLTVLGIIGGGYFLIKAIFQPAADMETRIIGSMIDFLPLIAIGANFALVYFIGVVVRSYYLNKYAEEFRLQHEYEKDEWYGRNYKK